MKGADAGGARMRWWVPGLGLLWLRLWPATGCTPEHKPRAGAAPEDAELELATVPWQTLWLLQSSEQECDYQETAMRPKSSLVRDLQSAEWLRGAAKGATGPDGPIGYCPVRFRPHVDPHRWLPRNLVVSECLCEGSPCARHSLHVCVTVFAVRTVYGLYAGRRRVLLAVGCLCTVQKARIAAVITPNSVD